MRISVKQGRIPSLAGAIFGIFWTIGVISMMIFIIVVFGGKLEFDGIMLLPFICIPSSMVIVGIFITIMGFYNAFAKNRISSADIVSYEEEPDPGRHLILNETDEDNDPSVLDPPPIVPGKRADISEKKGGFCPYCGARAEADFEFCRKCGKDI